MDRLTFEGNFCDIAMCKEVRYGSFCEGGACSQRKVWERLKHYEDLQEQGRLVVLPCKVGDMVYHVQDFRQGVVEVGAVLRVQSAMRVDETTTICMAVRYESGMNYYHLSDEIGKTVFLTREEAEVALKGGD